jgi:LEA14-like dessication related protein
MAKNNYIMTFIVIGAGLGGLWWLKNHQSPLFNAAGPNATLGIKILGIHPESDGSINMDLLIQNTNSKIFTLKSVVGELLLNNRSISSVKMFGSYTIQGNSEEMIPLQMKLNLKSIRDIASITRKGAILRLVGDININEHSLPVNMQHTL